MEKGLKNIKYARMLIEKLSGKWGATAGLRKQKDVLSRGGSTSLIRDAAVIAERFPSLLWGREEEKVRFMALNLRGHYKATKDPISSASSLINHLFGYENTRSCNLGKRHHIISTKTLIKSSAIQKPILPTEMYSSNNVVWRHGLPPSVVVIISHFEAIFEKKHIQLKYEQWVHFSTYKKRLCDFCSKWTITIYSRRVGETDNACDYGWWETDCVWHIRLCESTLAGSANSWSVRIYYGRLTMR